MYFLVYENISYFIYGWIALGVIIFLILLVQRAPYGRFRGGNWGPEIGNRLGWIVMESPSFFLFSFFFFQVDGAASTATWIFFSLWFLHYFYRSLIYPLLLHNRDKTIPLLIVALGFLFNTINSFLNGVHLGQSGALYPNDWLGDVRFITGFMLFVVGISINIHSDAILLSLRRPGEYGYKIPLGGLFRLVSCPNYLGEIIEWGGFALMVWALPATSFWIWVVANLLPRAMAYHRWYKTEFPHYPSSRKVIVPFLF